MSKPIKVIKRAQRELAAAQKEEVSDVAMKTALEIRREVFRTITVWIEEQKETQRTLSLSELWQPPATAEQEA